jgi:hypothetical protein
MHRTTVAATLAILALAASLSGCDAVPARFKGTPVTEERAVTAFDSIEVRGASHITIVAGAEYSLSIRANEEVIDDVRTSVVGTTLLISEVRSASPSRIEIVIHAPTLSSIEMLGAGDITVTGIENDRLAIAIAGAGDITVSGQATTVIAVLSGAGEIDTTGLEAQDVTVRLSGVGSIAVAASRSLDAELSGVGEIRYQGDPSVTSKVSGVGQISHA